MRQPHTFTPDTSDPRVCRTHDRSCLRPSCLRAVRKVGSPQPVAVRTRTYRTYLRDQNVGFDPRRYMQPAPVKMLTAPTVPVRKVIAAALAEHDPATRTYKGQRVQNSDMREAFMRAMSERNG